MSVDNEDWIEDNFNYCDLTSLKFFQIFNSISPSNFRSLKNKTYKLSVVISMLNFLTVIRLSETWLKANEQIENLSYYNFKASPRITGPEGRVGAYIRTIMFVFKLRSNFVMV